MTGSILAYRTGFGRRLIVALMASVLCSIAAPFGTRAAEAPPADLTFDVVRNDSVIGHHRVSFRQDGDKLMVNIDVAIKVDALFVTVYRYEQQREEAWRDGRLVAFTSRTNNDGDEYRITGERTADGLKVSDGKASWTVPLESLPISYWNVEMVRRGPLLDTIGGKLLEIAAKKAGEETIEAAGRRMPATRYRLEGERPRDLWYDAAGRWIGMRNKGPDGSTVDWVLK